MNFDTARKNVSQIRANEPDLAIIVSSGDKEKGMSCATCVFFDTIYADPASGICRAQPPVTIDGKAIWPDVESTDWCGHHTNK